MNDQVRKQLCLMVAQYSPSILQDPRRCRALLLDLCGDHRAEVNLLAAALEEGVAGRLLTPASGFPAEVLLAQQARLLSEVRYIEARAAHWAVETIAIAAGVIPANFTSAAKPDPPDSPHPFDPPDPRAPSAARPAVAATPAPAMPSGPLSLLLVPGVVLQLVHVPAGAFQMGSAGADREAFDDERPRHSVRLGAYHIAKYPVTQSQWAAFAKATGHTASAKLSRGKERHPVTPVSWDDAVAFTQWASQVSGRAVRLPTEAEWEKAARGSHGRKYPWGREAPGATRCNFDDLVKHTTPVGKYSPRGDSPYGAVDMAGNVLEWTSSLYAGYPYVAEDGREDPASREPRVLRGGSFRHVGDVRCAYRDDCRPNARFDGYGFRVAASRI
jgi:formylglycine-generating enzyme required for sulfatase activity